LAPACSPHPKSRHGASWLPERGGSVARAAGPEAPRLTLSPTQAEKRRVGALALKPEVVQLRCSMLQQLLDQICQPPYCASLEVRAFFGLTPSAAAAATSCADAAAPTAHAPSHAAGGGEGGGGAAVRPAVVYGAMCPACGRRLRVTAPSGAAEAALFKCPAPGCETVFKVALQAERT